MTTHNTPPPAQTPGRKPLASRAVTVLVTLACLAVVGAILWQLLPKAAFSSDLTRVGQGRPALVMLREVHIMGGDQVMEYMSQIHDEFRAEVEFLVVHTGNPDGQMFAATHDVGDGSLVLFDGDGAVIARIDRPNSSAELRQYLRQHL